MEGMKSVYQARRLYEGLTAIEDGGVRCFLIEGPEKAMLVDTGYGKGDLRAFVESLTDKPVFAVYTHADGDHTGCIDAFPEAYMHPAEFDYLAAKGRSRAGLRPLWDGDAIELGGWKFEVLHLPGHTPGSVMLLERAKRLLIAGDSVQTGSIYLFGPGRNLDAYILSLEKLEGLRGLFDTVLPSHGELPVPADILPALIRGAKDLRDGKLTAKPPLRPGMPCHSYRCEVASFLY